MWTTRIKYPNELNPPSARSHTVNIHCSNQRSPWAMFMPNLLVYPAT